MDQQEIIDALTDIAVALDDLQVEVQNSSIGVSDFNSVLGYLQEARGAQLRLVNGLITAPTGG